MDSRWRETLRGCVGRQDRKMRHNKMCVSTLDRAICGCVVGAEGGSVEKWEAAGYFVHEYSRDAKTAGDNAESKGETGLIEV